jgi:hypothetical protein
VATFERLTVEIDRARRAETEHAAKIEALTGDVGTARGMAALLYHRMMANGIAAESQATHDAVETVGRWLEATRD